MNHDIARARPDDIFIDRNGKLWRVIGYRSEPTVIMENVEDKERRCAGVTGLLWDGFERIYRPESAKR